MILLSYALYCQLKDTPDSKDVKRLIDETPAYLMNAVLHKGDQQTDNKSPNTFKNNSSDNLIPNTKNQQAMNPYLILLELLILAVLFKSLSLVMSGISEILFNNYKCKHI